MDKKKIIDGGIVVMVTRPTLVVDLVTLTPVVAMWYFLYRVKEYFNNQLVTIGIVVVGLMILGVSLRTLASCLSCLFTSYTLTSKSLIIKRGGLLSRHQANIPLSEIMGIETYGNIIWKLFGYSNLIIHTYHGSTIALLWIKKGKKFRQELGKLTGK